MRAADAAPSAAHGSGLAETSRTASAVLAAARTCARGQLLADEARALRAGLGMGQHDLDPVQGDLVRVRSGCC